MQRDVALSLFNKFHQADGTKQEGIPLDSFCLNLCNWKFSISCYRAGFGLD